MIARIWHGRVPAAKGDSYLEHMRSVAIPRYRAVPGNLAAARSSLTSTLGVSARTRCSSSNIRFSRIAAWMASVTRGWSSGWMRLRGRVTRGGRR